ncbi:MULTISPECIES: alkene reductase [unclassified Achromobacter]|uniref:alkene reductase n=1 Tax=unclassified Achromobacter TaxID=2626865 RepID=UPI000B516C78|nr:MULTISPECIES: alkene reductase [unclassified Achromobacter]OWT76793.1 alkene reductase [Achromobacter sp. HZ28]OWT77673.1 alkene reductase [Achromobacter sp. HZ34]
MTTFSSSLQVGSLTLPNRVIMAPLTRMQAGPGRVPTDRMVEYYSQRASAGLIITEATSVMAQGVGYPNTPGIWSDEQVDGWKKITDAVHARGGRIVVQLWHVGRISDPSLLDGELPVAPSAIAAEGDVSALRPKRPYVTPRALRLDEIPGIVAAYRKAAENAKRAGFDGVELHSANGYLLDQFLQDSTNHRDDAYGGSIENRARLLLEATDACIDVWGADRVGVHLSPQGKAHSISDSNPAATFGYVAREMNRRNVAFLCIREPLSDGRLLPQLKQAFGGAVFANDGFDQDTGATVLRAGEADAVAYGVLFIANPDLPERFARNAPLNAPNPATFYSGTEEGYIDYPALQAA